jgi:hypothetical protein
LRHDVARGGLVIAAVVIVVALLLLSFFSACFVVGFRDVLSIVVVSWATASAGRPSAPRETSTACRDRP